LEGISRDTTQILAMKTEEEEYDVKKSLQVPELPKGLDLSDD
jgi:hypothetical protein|tara:strand:+ start:378 stop:503 length:126 start_codon:yes stop_codon:yes gene_type:complete